MPKLKVLLSHTQHDLAITTALVEVLRAEFEVRSITDNVAGRAAPEGGVSDGLDRPDVVVPLVTSEWLRSYECREELARVYERRIPIILFRCISFADDTPEMPQYLMQEQSILWREEQLGAGLQVLACALRDISNNHAQNTGTGEVPPIRNEFHRGSPGERWQAQVANRLVGLAQRQRRALLESEACSFDISQARSYLRLAAPIFAEAQAIMEICFPSHSWIDSHFSSGPDTNLRIRQTPPASICRLFVFGSASEVMSFAPTLQTHHESYGRVTERNAVLLCSMSSYRELLQRWPWDVDHQTVQSIGLLSLDRTGQCLYTTLDAGEFRYKIYADGELGDSSRVIVRDKISALKFLRAGELDSVTGVARWDPGWLQPGGGLSDVLRTMFGDLTRPVTHIVLLRPAVDSAQLAEYLHCLAVRFHCHRAAFRLNRILVAKRCDLPVRDSRYTALLRVSTDFTYALIADFDDESSLQHYYQHELHSVERERLYVLLNPSVGAKFAEASRFDSMQSDRRAELFAAIEREMIDGGFIQRIDVRDDAPLATELSYFTLDMPAAHKEPAASAASTAATDLSLLDRRAE